MHYRLKDRNHPQAYVEFGDYYYFINNLGVYCEVGGDSAKLAEREWDVKKISESPDFEPAELITVGYDKLGNAITEWAK